MCRCVLPYEIFVRTENAPDKLIIKIRGYKMKKNLQIMLMCAAFAVIFGCAATGNAQMVGGYKAAPVDDAGVVAAAEFAVMDHSEKNEVSLEIVSIQKAERQVVQGMNYRLCVEVKVVEEGNDETQFVLVGVYQDLKRNYKLTKWEPDACGN